MAETRTVRVREYDYGQIEAICDVTGLPQHEAAHVLTCLAGRFGRDRLVSMMLKAMNQYTAQNHPEADTLADVTEEMRDQISPNHAEAILSHMTLVQDHTPDAYTD